MIGCRFGWSGVNWVGLYALVMGWISVLNFFFLAARTLGYFGSDSVFG
jgi:hypothetical protein